MSLLVVGLEAAVAAAVALDESTDDEQVGGGVAVEVEVQAYPYSRLALK